MIRRLTILGTAMAFAGCAAIRPATGDGPRPEARGVTTARAVHLARVQCLLVAPFENASDDPVAAEAATGALVSGIDPGRTTVYPIGQLRSIFQGTSMELPEGVSPSLALELAELIGADAALYGAVEGRARGDEAELTVTLRLAASGARDLLFARVVTVSPAPGLPLTDQVRRAILDASAPLLARLGIPGRKACFDRQRTDRLRLMALAGEQRVLYPSRPPVTAALPPAPAPSGAAGPAASAPPPAAAAEAGGGAEEVSSVLDLGGVEILPAFPKLPPPKVPMKVESAEDLPDLAEVAPTAPAAPTAVADAASRPSAAPPGDGKRRQRRVASAEPRPGRSETKALTIRQAEWLTRLQRGNRVLLEEVAFSGRSGQLDRDQGLHDVVALLGVAANLKVRLEGFVDASNDADGDLRISMEMARAVGKRLIQLGVARERVTWAGRGGESPVLPNFTARGRAANRRIELVAAE